MKELTNEDILKNRIDTIPQYYILNYLKKYMNIEEFEVYIVNRNTLKVIDKEKNHLYFKYDDKNKEVSYHEELKENFEIGL